MSYVEDTEFSYELMDFLGDQEFRGGWLKRIRDFSTWGKGYNREPDNPDHNTEPVRFGVDFHNRGQEVEFFIKMGWIVSKWDGGNLLIGKTDDPEIKKKLREYVKSVVK